MGKKLEKGMGKQKRKDEQEEKGGKEIRGKRLGRKMEKKKQK